MFRRRNRNGATMSPPASPGEQTDEERDEKARVKVLDRERRAIGTQSKERCVPEDRQAGVAEEQVHAHRADRGEQHLGKIETSICSRSPIPGPAARTMSTAIPPISPFRRLLTRKGLLPRTARAAETTGSAP